MHVCKLLYNLTFISYYFRLSWKLRRLMKTNFEVSFPNRSSTTTSFETLKTILFKFPFSSISFPFRQLVNHSSLLSSSLLPPSFPCLPASCLFTSFLTSSPHFSLFHSFHSHLCLSFTFLSFFHHPHSFNLFLALSPSVLLLVPFKSFLSISFLYLLLGDL